MSFDVKVQGFGAALADVYQRKLEVINRGFSGYTTKWGLPVLKQLLPTVEEQQKRAAKVKLMTIFFGANDASLPVSHQHVPLKDYKDNLLKMVSMIKNKDSPYYNPELRLILITPPPVSEEQWNYRYGQYEDTRARKIAITTTYAEAVREVGREEDVTVADLWTSIMDHCKLENRDLSEFFTDGLHLSALGNETVYELLIKTIEKDFPDIHPDVLKIELPSHLSLNHPDYEEQLKFELLK
ncbi:SGNH hydrolase-type esterase domain-containing protein [Spinellus fusiger]|nr:SGNH hydrolase-type esterase domain-containing protein [Spinellus fusiger]